MKTFAFPIFLIAIAGLFFACQKEEVAPPPPPTETKDEVTELPGSGLTVADLLQASPGGLIGYLDQTEKILFADFERLENLREQFTPLSTTDDIWVIETNGLKAEYFLVPLAELSLDKPVGEKDEVTKKDEYCKKVTNCFYGRTSKKYYRFPGQSPEACVVRKDEVCTGKPKSFDLEVHSENNCVTPETDENGKVILKKITITVCSR
jgi:hypothetical protein